jgi:hypothetical protein
LLWGGPFGVCVRGQRVALAGEPTSVGWFEHSAKGYPDTVGSIECANTKLPKWDGLSPKRTILPAKEELRDYIDERYHHSDRLTLRCPVERTDGASDARFGWNNGVAQRSGLGCSVGRVKSKSVAVRERE